MHLSSGILPILLCPHHGSPKQALPLKTLNRMSRFRAKLIPSAKPCHLNPLPWGSMSIDDTYIGPQCLYIVPTLGHLEP